MARVGSLGRLLGVLDMFRWNPGMAGEDLVDRCTGPGENFLVPLGEGSFGGGVASFFDVGWSSFKSSFGGTLTQNSAKYLIFHFCKN